ncbi:MAG: hypothetical protein GQ535_12505 [Rhodobacteraceae bacterium]|nr:hypothetical protein [Paracoccaceae bacterium]
MDYQKINSRWIYGLVLQVFGRNLVTFIIIAFLNTVFAVASGFVPFMGIGSVIATVYLGGVSFMVAHKTILQGAVLSPGEAFAFTPQSKTYFWQYLFIIGIPAVLGFIGGIAMFLSENLPFEPVIMVIIWGGVTSGIYYLVMAFFGTSLVATAVGGDGMMMVSRGRETFFYSLTRLILLPSLALGAFGAAVYYVLFRGDAMGVEGLAPMFGDNANDAILTLLLLSVAAQLVAILFNMITAVIVTKAFLLAEVRLALKGQPTEWGKQAFGITDQTRGVVYR